MNTAEIYGPHAVESICIGPCKATVGCCNCEAGGR